MNLVTKCPSCYTSFVVKPEQLESHDGQVRCGQCQHIFIAHDYLSEPASTEATLPSIHPKKSLRWMLYIFLFILAIMQTLFFMRADIARQWPAFKPALTHACHFLGCKLPLPQKAELLAIDDTELVKDEMHEGIVKFNSLIINNAPFAQDFPSIELTLTDAQDLPVIRRKITPKEYLKGSKANLDNGLTANDEVHVTLNLKVADQPVSGFRAYLVY
jgi:predicted Zn finger-like uncharacterized protein